MVLKIEDIKEFSNYKKISYIIIKNCMDITRIEELAPLPTVISFVKADKGIGIYEGFYLIKIEEEVFKIPIKKMNDFISNNLKETEKKLRSFE